MAMTNKKFDKVIRNQIKLCEDTLIRKSAEYTTTGDRLANIRSAAALQRVSIPAAWAGQWSKHVVSIIDMTQSGADHDLEKWNEKITDGINYLLLLKAIVVEEFEHHVEPATCANCSELITE
jgi:hypothetical protein